MALVGPEAFAIRAVPGADDVVFGDAEDEVAFFGESATQLESVGKLHVFGMDVGAYFTCVSARSWPERSIGLILAVFCVRCSGEGVRSES